MFNLDNNTVLFLAAIVGTFANWVNLRTTNKVAGSPWTYLVEHPYHTIAMVMSVLTACTGLTAGTDISKMDTIYVIVLGFNTGYTLDSIINKGKSPVGVGAKPSEQE